MAIKTIFLVDRREVKSDNYVYVPLTTIPQLLVVTKKFIIFPMKLDEEELYIKIAELNEIYNFVDIDMVYAKVAIINMITFVVYF
jgi:SpoVK/Ycf46/Vps4 family AAA+-type ATPase